MKLYALRHGHAPSIQEAKVKSDEERPLSAEGRRMVQKTMEYLKSQGGSPEIILTSPLRRAKETAQEAQGVLKPSQGLKIYTPLANEISGEELYLHIEKDMAKIKELILVGHQPQLGELASYLTGQTFELKPGGAIALETNAGGKSRVLWHRNP